MLNSYDPETEYPPETKSWIESFLRKLETQYPSHYDNTVKTVLKKSGDEESRKNQHSMRKIIQGATALQDSFDAFEKLYHPNSAIRVEGIKVLAKCFGKFLEKDKELLQQTLVDRLNDDSPEVVSETLINFKERFSEVVCLDELKGVLEKLLVRCQSEDVFQPTSPAVIDVLCGCYDADSASRLVTLLPFLLPISKRELKLAKRIVSSRVAQDSEFLKEMCPQLLQTAKAKEFFSIVSNRLGEPNNFDPNELRAVPRENLSPLGRYLVLVLLSGCARNIPELEVLDSITACLQEKTQLVDGEIDLKNCASVAKRGKLPLQGVLECLCGLVERVVRSHPSCLPELDFSSGGQVVRFYLSTLTALFGGKVRRKKSRASAYKSALAKVLTHCCKTPEATIGFLLNVSTCDESLRLNCLKTVEGLVKESKSDLLGFESLVVPLILVNLNSDDIAARKLCFAIIEAMQDDANNGYAKLLTGLLEMREELVLDNQQLPQVLQNLVAAGNKAFLHPLLELACTSKCGPYLNAGIIGALRQINSYEIFNKTACFALELLEKDGLSKTESQVLQQNYARIDVNVAPHLLFDSNAGKLIKRSLELDKPLINQNCPAVLVLNQIDREIFAAFKQIVQVTLVDLVVTASASLSSVEVHQEVFKVFKHIDLDAALVLTQLQKMRDVQSPKLDTGKRVRRVTIIPTVDILDTIEWKKGVVVLECLQDKKKMHNTTLLLPVLFEMLKKCLDFEEQASVEYVKQLLLTCILHCCEKRGSQDVPENAFDMQLVVQCVRASQNPQTHHHALLLLAYTAALIPNQVLHHIVAIFTFMGSSVLRHDDAYSFQIIAKIVDTIIPILVQDGAIESVARVLRVFVDAIVDIPEHRRITLFNQLLTRLGAKEHLQLFLLLVFEAHVAHAQQKVVPKRLEVAATICNEFHPDIVIETCIKLTDYLRKLPDEKHEQRSAKEAAFPFDVGRYTAKQFRHYKYTLVSFTAGLLGAPELVTKVAALTDVEALQLQELFKGAIVSILTYVQVTTKVAERNATTPHAQYWKVLLHHSHDILDSLQALLTPQMFLLVVRGLVVHSLPTVRRRSLELLNAKLQSNTNFFADCSYPDFEGILQSLLTIIKSASQEAIEQDQELIVQTALLSLKLLVRFLSPENPQKFVPILSFISDLTKSIKKQDNILASVILCLAELCSNLRAHAISSLNKFMPVLVRVLKSQRKLESPSLLLLSDTVALQKILDVLPLFLSPYLEKLLHELGLLSCKWNASEDDAKLKPFLTKVNAVKEKIGSAIPLRVLLPSVENCYKAMVENGEYSAIAGLMSILQLSVNNLQGADIQKSVHDLSVFYLSALQFRSESSSLSLEEIGEVESHVIAALTTFVLKLSESSFRPFYYKLYDWAARSDAKTERIITFYNLSSSIGKSLKGLFVLFAGHFLNNAATLLDATNKTKNAGLYFEDDSKNVLLLENILRTLHCVFLYDSQRFTNKERFDVLMQPIVDQLENSLGGDESLQARADAILIPCIVEFAVALADDALWKQMNYQILLKTRHSSPGMRLMGLRCITEVAKRLGDDFLPLLPETIPFLAELLEDEEEGVEQSCRRSVQELEKVLGEPLQKYF